MMRMGKAGLPRLLDTAVWSHSGILRADAAKIVGFPVAPRFGQATRRYLVALYHGLASTDVVRRCAFMVAFELHASAMIESLWGTIVAVTSIPREELGYFHLHLGGDDPAEKYHIETTQRLIERVVPPLQHDRFLAEFEAAYRLNVDWCDALVRLPIETLAPENGEVCHRGSCHCGGVKFEVRAPSLVNAVRCNCSICSMSGFLHLLVSADRFKLVAGVDLLTTYQFNERIAKHTFCRVCGMKPFYRPRSNPSGYSVNVRCIDRATIAGVEIREFDGERWEESIHELAEPA